MIVTARNPVEWQALTGFLRHYAHVQPTPDMVCIGWIAEGKLVVVVGFNGFMGNVAQVHVAMADGWHFSPRQMLREVFKYGFDTAKREVLLGILNSKNESAMRLDLHLGFREVFRMPGLHDDGGDIVLLAMKKSECRYLDAPDTVEVAQAGRA